MITVQNPQDLYHYSTQAEALPGLEALDEQAVASYWSDGFVAVQNLLSLDEVAMAKVALTDLIHGRVPGFNGIMPEPEVKERWPAMTSAERAASVRKVWLFAQHEERLRTLAEHPTVHGVLQRLLGEPGRLIQDMALLKPPFVGSEKPWHQDMAYFGWQPPEKIIGVWIALDEATAENGCMHVLPGTHREGAVPHAHVRDCQIPDEHVQVERDVLVPLAPGGALFFASLLHHGTPPNNSPQTRWALQFHYAGLSAEPMDKAQHAALYSEGTAYAGCRG